MALAEDGRILWALLRGQPGQGSLQERLNGFYGPQAAQYDQFRERLLQGRSELLHDLAGRLNKGDSLLEMGAGTGRNLAFLSPRLDDLARVELVDLCQPLLAQAEARWRHLPQVQVIEADATCYRPQQPVDAVYFSYSLSMIPDWFSAIDNALALLKPGGWLAVVDFYVSRRSPAPGHRRHGALCRHFWPAWFAHDGVQPSPDHLPYLEARCERVSLAEEMARVPYLPLLRVPYYRFLGRKKGQ
ncbi:class I SAM-dependent methyltransferase [Magnetovirga frankeli]|uniref:class I SAM-dependent methyltransferase n=1 Tax=Magnetovirga frankeli TaxID=947516 RepID=UPI0012939374|nr:class I SAM-dependent methyltransferase [gamma proteobacterium SS-5]